MKSIYQDVKTIAVTSGMISEEKQHNAQRQVLVLKNTSLAGEIISIGVNQSAQAGKGIILNQGETVQWSIDNRYTPPQCRIFALASVATATLAIYEEIEA